MRKDGSTLVKRLTVGSLFSGLGGIDLGLERAGMRVRWQVENDPYCRAVLRAHWPKATLHNDVRRKIHYEPVDVVAGGFPCQPVSNAGLRLHDADPRWLWPQMLKVVKYVQPRWVLVENVEGLRTKGLCDVLEGLAECGYDAEWLRVPAAAVGAPHQRRRYFVVGYPSRCGREEGACVFREPTGFVDAANSVVPVADANGERDSESSPLANSGRKRRQQVATGPPREEEANGWRSQEDHEFAGARESGLRTDWGDYEPAVRRWEAISGRPSPQPLIRRVDDGLSRGMALGTLTDELKALGNAVVPQVAEYVGRCIVAADREMYGA